MSQLRVYNQATGNYVEIIENDGVGLFLDKKELTYQDLTDFFYKRAEQGKCFSDYIVVTPGQYECLLMECMGMVSVFSNDARKELERFIRKRRYQKGDQLEFDFIN